MTSHTTIVLIQNGLDIELPLIATFPTNPIMSAVSMIGSSTADANRVVQIGADVLTIGPQFHHCGVGAERISSRPRRNLSTCTMPVSVMLPRLPFAH